MSHSIVEIVEIRQQGNNHRFIRSDRDDRRGRRVRDLPGTTIEGNELYTVSVWDMDEQDWVTYRENLTRMGLREAVRDVEGRGYSKLSYHVMRQ